MTTVMSNIVLVQRTSTIRTSSMFVLTYNIHGKKGGGSIATRIIVKQKGWVRLSALRETW